MKRYNIKALLIVALSMMVFSACEDDIDKPGEWPKWGNPSKPFVTNAEFIFPEPSADILLGDEGQFSVILKDQYNDLKQADLEIMLGNNVIFSKTYSLKDLEADLVSDFKIPFLKNIENNTKLAAKLKISNETNNGITEYTLPEELQLSIKRPQFAKLYIVDDQGLVVELSKESTSDHIYTTTTDITGLSSRIWIAQKVTAQNRPVYSAFVWGMVDDEIVVVGENEGQAIPVVVPDGGTLKSVSFNSFTFQTSDLLFNSINGTEMNNSPIQGYMELLVDLTKGQEVTFLGFGNVANKLNVDFFINRGETKATFDGNSGKYKILYNLGSEFLYIEKEGTTLPDAMWICGSGLGFPQAPFVTTTQWNWNIPTDYIYCKKVADNVFEATVYANAFMFKFFHQKGWGAEEDGRTYTKLSENVEDGRNEWGDKTGDFAPGSSFVPGVYKLILDRNAKTIMMQSVN